MAVPVLAVLFAVALHACGSTVGAGQLLGEERRAETPSSPPLIAREDPAPSQTPKLNGEPVPTVDINQDTSLEALLPDRLRGIDLLKVSVAGEAFETDASTRALLLRLGASPEDASAAFAVDPSGRISGQVVALRVAGADSEQLRDEYRAAVEALAGSELREVTIAGKPILTGTNPEDPASAVYFYARGDVLFFVFTDDMSLAAEALAILP